EFYRRLFLGENNEQESQIFIATHSPFIIHDENRVQEKVIVLERNEKGYIHTPSKNKFFGWTNEQIVEDAFDIDQLLHSTSQANNAFLFLVKVEGSYDVRYITKAADLLGRNNVLSKIRLEDADGCRNLDKIWNVLKAHLETLHMEKLVLLYDCDTNKTDENINSVYKRVVPNFEDHPIKRGIENLFSQQTIDKAIAHKPAFIDIEDERSKMHRGKKELIPKQYSANKDEKGNLCDWLCKDGTKEDFANFKVIFDIIDAILKEH
ncbi:hypothetical protein HOH51_02890, partial [bacterium]|nr:hypothetical protein [bacterium]